MKILFVAPRYHTNQIPIVEGLLNYGISVSFLAMYKGFTENYDVLEPDYLGLSPYLNFRYKRCLKKNGSVYAENWLIRNYRPQVYKILNYLKKVDPDVIILRERSKQSRLVYACCRILGMNNVILYNQQPLNYQWNITGVKKFISNIIFPLARITPVKSIDLITGAKNNLSNLNNQHDYFVPFIQNITPSNNSKIYMYKDKIRILDVGKYRSYKNHKLLVDAISLIPDLEDVQVTIIGQVSNDDEQQYYRMLQKEIDNNNLSNNFQLLKNVPYNEMEHHYNSNDILVLPSKKEVASVSILEAMAHGLCIISTDNNGTASYVTDGNAGYVFDHKSSSDLSNKISYLMNNRGDIKDFGKNAQMYINNFCSFNNYLISLNNVLEKEFNINILK